jgi:predicted RNase H-like HicB family nuclease
LIVGSGETPEEAKKELQICIGEVLKSYEEYGWEIPNPTITHQHHNKAK